MPRYVHEVMSTSNFTIDLEHVAFSTTHLLSMRSFGRLFGATNKVLVADLSFRRDVFYLPTSV